MNEKLTIQDLQEMQQWPLERKVAHTIDVLSSFVNRVGGLDKVYLSCSFGKDSCVLLDIATRIYPDIKVVFCNTGNEHPSVVKLCNECQKTGRYNLEVIRPKKTPRQVWAEYGFPLVGKETAFKVHVIRTNPNCASAKHFLSDTLDNGKVNKYVLPHKWRYLIDEPYETHNHCCAELKKKPFRKYEKDSGRYPILGIMAEESQMRKGQWVRWGGGVTRSLKTQSQCRCRYGLKKTFGNTLKDTMFLLPKYIVRGLQGLDVYRVDLESNVKTTKGLKSYMNTIRNTIR